MKMYSYEKKLEKSRKFHERIEARLEREKRETRRGLMIFRNYERMRRNKYTLPQIVEKQSNYNWEKISWPENGTENISKPEFQEEETTTKKIQSLKNYPLTELSILRRNLQMKRDKAWKRYVNNFRKKKLIASLNCLKLEERKGKHEDLCLFSERKKQSSEENWYLTREQEFSEQNKNMKLINNEDYIKLDTGNEKWLNLMKMLEEVSNESTIIEDPVINEIEQKKENVDENNTIKKEEIKSIKCKKNLINFVEFKETQDTNLKKGKSCLQNSKQEAPSLSREGEDNFDFLVEDLDSKASKRMRDPKKGMKMEKKEMQRDTCFYSYPSDVIFKDFEVGKIYNRKIMIFNKSSKWAYLRFDSIDWKTASEKSLEIEIEGPVRLRPGLKVPMIVKFSPKREEDFQADLIFLTLSPEHPEEFHIFRISVRCIPEKPKPLVEPTEVKFPSLPIWKYRESDNLQKTVTISNQGSKPFFFTIVNKPEGESIWWDFLNSESKQLKNPIQTDAFVLDFQIQDDYKLQNKISNTFPSRETGNLIKLDLNFDKAIEKSKMEVKPDTKFELIIKFAPKYVGIHREAVTIDFESRGTIFERKVVAIYGEVQGLNISIDPLLIDLGMIITDSEVYQQNFNIINTGNTSMPVMIKTPKCLENQIKVFPKSTIVQSKGSSVITVQLIPKENITNNQFGYYDETSNIVTIPIKIKPTSIEANKASSLILKVLATVTTSHALILNPESLFLGQVHTQESVISEIFLTNQSLTIQDFGFLNLPHCIEIQPNYGFGKILPGETLKLDLIYSPSSNDFPEKDKQSIHNRICQIQAITIAELAGNKILIEKAKSGKNLELKKNFDKGKKDMLEYFKDASYDRNSNSGGNDSNEPEIFDFEEKTKEKRYHKNIMEIYIQVVNLFCELSDQIIQFLPTPCGSFSTASIQLRGFICPPSKKKRKKFKASFEFKTSSEFVKVAPEKGFLQSNDFVKISFLLAPKFPDHLVFQKLQESKAAKIEKQIRNSKQEIAKFSTKVGKKDAADKKSQGEENSFAEKLLEDLNPLENFEPYVFTTLVTCKIKIEENNGLIDNQTLFAKLYCSVVKPDIIILNNSRNFDFGPTAIGTTERKILYVKNISNRKVKIDSTLLNPFGPFFMPPGKFVEAGSILTLPITFSPQEGEDCVKQFFEIRAAGSLSMWRLSLSGSCVVPSWIIEPKILVARLEAKPGSFEDLKMKIKNTGECYLTFKLKTVDLVEGPIFSSNRKNSQEMKKKEKGIKGWQKKDKFSLRLTEEETEAIYGNKLSFLQNQNTFSFLNFDEKMCLRVPPKESADFIIRFQPAKYENKIETRKKIKQEVKIKGKRDVSEFESNVESIYQIGRFNLSLGNTINVQDIILICQTK